MTTHTHPELEARIAALEAHMKRDTDAIAQAVAELKDDAKAQPECFAKPAAPNADEAADALPDDLSAAINAARDGEITDEHVGTMLHYLKVDAAEIAALRAKLAEEVNRTQYWMHEALGRDSDGDERDAALRGIVADRDRLAAQVDMLQASLDAANSAHAQVESLTRERDQHAADKVAIRDVLVGHGHGSSIGEATRDVVAGVCWRLNTAEDQRDRIMADLALANQTCAEKQTIIEKFIASESELMARCIKTEADLAAVTERAEKAEAEAKQARATSSFHKDNHIAAESVIAEITAQRDAARAEADALRNLLKEALEELYKHHNSAHCAFGIPDDLLSRIRAAGVEVE